MELSLRGRRPVIMPNYFALFQRVIAYVYGILLYMIGACCPYREEELSSKKVATIILS